MRAILVTGLFVVMLLAGCTQGTPGRDGPLQQTCPAWVKGLGSLSMAGPGWFHPNLTHTQATDNLSQTPSLQGRPLDWIELDFFVKRNPQNGSVVLDNGTPVQQYLYVEKGTLMVQFFRQDDGKPLQAYDSSRGAPGQKNPKQDTLTWSPGFYSNFTIHVDLVDSSQPADPTTVVAVWTILGERSGNADTSAWALRDTTVFFWYRTCNDDDTTAVYQP